MGLLSLTASCIVMLIGSFLCGYIPLTLNLSTKSMRYISTIGIGLLIGTAFIIIIPEGIHTIYNMDAVQQSVHTAIHSETVHTLHNMNRQLQEGNNNNNVQQLDDIISQMDQLQKLTAAPIADSINIFDTHTNEQNHQSDTQQQSNTNTIHTDNTDTDTEHIHSTTVSIQPSDGSLIGPSLAFGFIFMILVDKFSGGNSHIHVPDTHTHTHNDTSISILTPRQSPNTIQNTHSTPSMNQSAMIGILVHSAVDGLALGAISVSENKTLELVVFLAIILHKGPAAFGLVSFLSLSGRTRVQIIRQLLIFSLAAPITALLTYCCFNGFNVLTDNTSHTINTVYLGVCLLFSAGTFLFTIAVHILPEIHNKHSNTNNSNMNGKTPASDINVTEWKQTICLIVGILLPWGISASHAHAH